jgi:hypothetical protein
VTDPKNPYCWDDKHSKVICAKRTTVSSKFNLEINKNYETTTTNSHSVSEAEEKRHSCGKPRFYNYETAECECPRNKVRLQPALNPVVLLGYQANTEQKWTGKTCAFPPLKKPVCKTGVAYCAKSAHQIVHYSKENHLCQDNGKNYVFCCEAESATESCLTKSVSRKEKHHDEEEKDEEHHDEE